MQSARGSNLNSYNEPLSERVWKDSNAGEIYGSYLDDHNEHVRSTVSGANGAGVHHADIAVGLMDSGEDVLRKPHYSGRKRIWPGALFLILLTITSLALITYFGIQTHSKSQEQLELSEEIIGRGRKKKKIIPPKGMSLELIVSRLILINSSVCVVPNYVTSGTKIFATHGSVKHEVHFTGVNWSGMENKEGIPHGLAYRQSDVDTIAQKLAKHKFNAVRLPLNAKMIIEDSPVDLKKFLNAFQNPDLVVETYVGMIKKVIQALAKQQIVVLLDIHKIDPEFKEDTSEHLWYTKEFPIEVMMKMYQKLATELCNEFYYNIVGIDIKNEPIKGCWPAKAGDKECPPNRDWPRAVESIGNAILEICPNWLIVVEGLYAENIKAKINGKTVYYNDWYGASASNATLNPIVLNVPNKVAFAIHWYSPSVYPTSIYFQSHETTKDGSISVVEYPATPAGDVLLHSAMDTVMNNAFGQLLDLAEAPVFYGEFGGIYGDAELLPGKTSTRAIDYLMEFGNARGMVGGFYWSLNPDGHFAFNDKYVKDYPFQYGLYNDETWQEYHADFSLALQKLEGNGVIPCFTRAGSISNSTNLNGTTSSAISKPKGVAPSSNAAVLPAAELPGKATALPAQPVAPIPVAAPVVPVAPAAPIPAI
uniref:Cell 5A endo1 putative n=1 Tax=Albugo laibachii Nc14 TaxID=890382 RepID=F0X127_9STRA|nr:cell 5A endo1 putative [Albugo laibachii Nc14]|eukprot:CCA27479.1 cell 5A endo1 putative [Albugo laibachii Nc14]